MQVDGKTFQQALATASKTTARQSPVKILCAVKLEADGHTLTISSTDMEVSTQVRVPCTGALAAIVNAKNLAAAVKGHKGPLTLTVTDDVLTVGAFTFPTLCADDYPRLPDPQGNVVATVSAATWREVAERTTVAASRDKSRPLLTATRIEIDGTLRMIATDSYRLAVTTRDGATGTLATQLPTRAVELAGKHLTGTISIRQWANQCALSDGTTTILTRIIDGQYPDWQRLSTDMDGTDDNLIPADQFMQAVATVKPACQRNTPARLTFNADTLTVHGETHDGPTATATVTDCDNHTADDGPFTIGFNAGFLADIGKVLGTDGSYRVRTRSPLKPVTFLNGNDDSWYLIMPIRLAS